MKTSKFTIRKTLTALCVIAIGAFTLTISCTKDNTYNAPPPTDTSKAFLSVTNASPGSTAYDVYTDSTKLSTSGQLGYGITSGSGGSPYYTTLTGTHKLRLTSDGSSYVIDSSVNFQANNHYTVFAYDTLNSGKLKTLILNDNLTMPASGQSSVRFLPLSNNAGAVNVWLIHGADTATLSNLPYIGISLISPDSLATFRSVPAGTYKVAVNEAINDLTLFHTDSLTISDGKIYTFYLKGLANTTGPDSLSIGTIQHN